MNNIRRSSANLDIILAAILRNMFLSARLHLRSARYISSDIKTLPWASDVIAIDAIAHRKTCCKLRQCAPAQLYYPPGDGRSRISGSNGDAWTRHSDNSKWSDNRYAFNYLFQILYDSMKQLFVVPDDWHLFHWCLLAHTLWQCGDM